MAQNLTIIHHMIVGIYKIGPVETMVRRAMESQAGCMAKVSNVPVELPMATHEAHLADKSLVRSIDNIIVPGQEVGVVIWFGAASALGRPSHSKALLFKDEIYYILTWTDVLGSGHRRQCDLYRKKDKRMVIFLRLVDNPAHKQLILDRIHERDLV